MEAKKFPSEFEPGQFLPEDPDAIPAEELCGRCDERRATVTVSEWVGDWCFRCADNFDGGEP